MAHKNETPAQNPLIGKGIDALDTQDLMDLKKEADAKSSKKSSKKTEKKGPGVIETIAEVVGKAGEKGVSKKAILAKLVQRFPERATEGMSKTINVQLPKRMSRERKINIVKLDNGNFLVRTKAPKKTKKAA